jgi:undecaprenyl diphosphate synthase
LPIVYPRTHHPPDPAPHITPRHVAIIMDGNGRWATRRGLPRQAGHRAGVKAARVIVQTAARRGIDVLTLFAFSSENWRRPAREVGFLMNLFAEALQREIAELHRNDVRLSFIGDRSALSSALTRQMEKGETLTRGNGGLQLVIAVAYGGRWDLVQAARRIAENARAGMLDPAAIDEARLASELAVATLPDPDLFIRTGGEMRVSNFLLWNLAYTELYFSPLLWPDFDAAALDAALDFYAGRERRFGRTGAETEGAGS